MARTRARSRRRCAYPYQLRAAAGYFEDKGDLHRAIADFNQAIRLDPQDAVAY
jgi:hypothetical protein